MLGRLKELTELNGVSGNEKAVRKYLKEFAINYADEVFTDAMGNLYAHKKGDGKRFLSGATTSMKTVSFCTTRTPARTGS